MPWQVRAVKMAIQYVVLLRWGEIRAFATKEGVSWSVACDMHGVCACVRVCGEVMRHA